MAMPRGNSQLAKKPRAPLGCTQSTFARTPSDISTNILLALAPARPSVAFLERRRMWSWAPEVIPSTRLKESTGKSGNILSAEQPRPCSWMLWWLWAAPPHVRAASHCPSEHPEPVPTLPTSLVTPGWDCWPGIGNRAS